MKEREELETFNSLSRDHMMSVFVMTTARRRGTFNSLSRDHLVTELRKLLLPIELTFNSLSRDHSAEVGEAFLGRKLSTPSLGITAVNDSALWMTG